MDFLIFFSFSIFLDDVLVMLDKSAKGVNGIRRELLWLMYSVII